MITGVKKMKLKDGRLLDRTMTKSETRASPEPTAKKSIKPGTSTSAVKGQAIKTDDQITKNIEIEKPLYRRLQDKYREKLKKELTAMKEEKRKLMDHRGNYSNIDFLNHLAAYKKKKQELKEKYERKRIEKLKKLGLIEGKSKNPNVSFDSKLWLFNEPEPVITLHDSIVAAKHKARGAQAEAVEGLELRGERQGEQPGQRRWGEETENSDRPRQAYQS
jgi:hypothetical protein